MPVVDLIKLAVPYGIFAILFVSLFVWVLNENAKRETNYIKVIDNLSECYKGIKNDISLILKLMERK